MEPGPLRISVTCTTCKGKLVVRNERAIGQILPCPKCGSMVMIEPPAGYVPPAAEGASEPPTADAPNHNAPPVAAPPVAAGKPTPTAAGQTSPPAGQKEISGGRPLSPRARAALEMGEQTETVDDSSVLSRSDFPTPPATPAGEEPPSGPLLPSQAALPGDRWQKPVLYGAAGLGGVLALLLVIGYLFSGGEENPQTAHGETPGEQETETPTAETPPSDDTPDPTPEEDIPSEVDPSETDPTDLDPADPDPTEDPAEEPDPTDETPEDNSSEGDGPKAVGPDIDIDDSPAAPVEPDLDSMFGQFEALIDGEEPTDTPAPDATAEEPDADLTAEWPELPLRDRPAFTPVDVAARLNDPIASISLEGTSLRDLLRLMSGMTTIPLAIDAEALSLAQVSLSAPITLTLTDTTAGEVLAEALSQHGLTLRVAGGSAIIEKAAPAEELRSVRYEVGDLAQEDPEQLEQLAGLFRQLAPAESWIEAGGPATLAIEGEAIVVAQQEPVHYQLALLCEKLRVARGLPAGAPPLAAATLETRLQLAEAKLATNLRLNYPEPTLLRVILDRLEKEADVTLLVDWEALVDFGWPGSSEATLTIDEGTLEEALYRLLAPMELSWRAIDGDTFEISTEDAIEQRLELELYPLDPETVRVLEPGDVADHIAMDLGHFQTGGASGMLWYDETSGTLVALLPQPTQRKLASMLRTWRPFLGG